MPKSDVAAKDAFQKQQLHRAIGIIKHNLMQSFLPICAVIAMQYRYFITLSIVLALVELERS